MSTSMRLPFGIGARGAVTIATGHAQLRQQIEQVLFCIPGERVGRPKFGIGIQKLVFGGTDDATVASIEYSVSQALRQALGAEIEIEAVRVTTIDAEMNIDILFTDRASGEPLHMTARQPLEGAP